jgi:hypothetical protein
MKSSSRDFHSRLRVMMSEISSPNTEKLPALTSKDVTMVIPRDLASSSSRLVKDSKPLSLILVSSSWADRFGSLRPSQRARELRSTDQEEVIATEVEAMVVTTTTIVATMTMATEVDTTTTTEVAVVVAMEATTTEEDMVATVVVEEVEAEVEEAEEDLRE